MHTRCLVTMPYAQEMAKRPQNVPQETDEAALIRRLRARAGKLAGTGLSLGIGDDCALLRVRAGEEVAITTDLSIASRHFLLDLHPPEVVGHRALARGLSDLAAMGARPVAAFLSLGLPRELTVATGQRKAWIDRFYDGLLALAAKHKTPLAGGDLAESPVALVDIVLAGAVPRGTALLRSGAHPGDAIYVTGTLGGAEAGLAGLKRLKQEGIPAAIPKKLATQFAAHLAPQPRIAQGLWLRREGIVTSAIDISDGLSTDLGHICEESGVAAEVDESRVPVHPMANMREALHGGEDYELLFTTPGNVKVPSKIEGVQVTRIGRIKRRRVSACSLRLQTPRGPEPLVPEGWQHFDKRA